MNIFKYLLPWITLLFFIATGVHANDSDKKKNYDKDGKKYHQKKWDKKGKMMWGKQRKQGRQGQCKAPAKAWWYCVICDHVRSQVGVLFHGRYVRVKRLSLSHIPTQIGSDLPP